MCKKAVKKITLTCYRRINWICRRHISSIKNTIFENCKVPVYKILEFFYLFLLKSSFSTLKLITVYSTKTVARFLLNAYEVLEKNITERDTQMGGPGIIV
ncbi:hypothetical protein H312_02928 [Anncaliia algerae PRA339]|uniref:Uncharacterized protein n=1 Tax=Anncaliia algerae PRA339 TaxID=1288291 RepID=A0A059EXU6_9MICR|nr:hypothetical protein H312_02928 [Anncaliia algerae PRA339]